MLLEHSYIGRRPQAIRSVTYGDSVHTIHRITGLQWQSWAWYFRGVGWTLEITASPVEKILF